MWTAVALLICLALCAAIAAATFEYGRQVGYIKRNNELLQDQAKDMRIKIDEDALLIQQLSSVLDEKEMQRARQMAEKQQDSDGWDVFRSRA